MGDLLYMYFVVVFADLDVGGCVRRLQNMRGDVVVVVGDERKWERGSECRCSRKKETRFLKSQSRCMGRQVRLTV